MTKRETWLFAVVCTLLAGGTFIGLTIHSHTRFDDITNTENLTPTVKAGMKVWHSYNCVNCHTIFGEGAYYAPDLTNITDQRGEAYLKAFLKKPSRFYSEEEYGRVMPNLDMTDEEIDKVIAFLDWISDVKTNGWPPRPIRVTGEAIASAGNTTQRGTDDQDADPVAKGRRVFNDSQIGCNACHSTSQGVTIVGPSMAGLQSRTSQLLDSGDYTGDAESAKAYIRESIVEPDAHILEGQNFSTNGTSLMPGDYADRMSETQLDNLVAYLMTLE